MKVAVLFIHPSFGFNYPHPQDAIPPMMAVSAVSLLRSSGHEVSLLDSRYVQSPVIKTLCQYLKHLKPDFTAIFFSTPQYDYLKKFISHISRFTKVIGCGQHSAHCPDDLKNSGAIASVKEDDTDFSLLKIINNTYGHEKSCFDGPEKLENTPELDLDTLPFLCPEYSTNKRYRTNTFAPFSFKKPKWGFMLTSRGCPYHCLFCSDVIRETRGHNFRAQSPERVVEELKFLTYKHSVNAINFTDDIFTADLGRAEKILELSLEKNCIRPWVAQTHAAHINKDFMRLAQLSGCIGIIIGVESGSPEILEKLGKGITVEQIIKARRLAALYRIPVLFTVVFGHPGETVSDMKKTVRLMKKIQPDMLQAHIFTPYPGSKAARLFGSSVKGHHYNILEKNLSNASSENLKAIMSQMLKSHYLSPSTFVKTTLSRLPSLIHDPFGEAYRALFVIRS